MLRYTVGIKVCVGVGVKRLACTSNDHNKTAGLAHHHRDSHLPTFVVRRQAVECRAQVRRPSIATPHLETGAVLGLLPRRSGAATTSSGLTAQGMS